MIAARPPSSASSSPASSSPSSASLRIVADDGWGRSLDRGAPIEVVLDGRSMTGFVGDTAASLLWAHGERAFFAGSGHGGFAAPRYFDPFDRDGWVWVAGEGLVPAGGCRLGDGDVLAGLRTRIAAEPVPVSPPPSRRRRLGRVVTDRRPMTKPARPAVVGRPRPVWPEPSGRTRRARPGPARRIRTDVLVAGAGLAGLTAARAAADEGARVLLVEADDRPGGTCRWSSSESDRRLLHDAVAAVLAHPGVEVLVDAVVVETGPNGRALVTGCSGGLEHVIEVEAATVVLATGVVDRRLAFDGNDLPGVMTATGADRLLSLWAVRPGERALVVCDRGELARGEALGDRLRRAGVEVVELVDLNDLGEAGGALTAAGGAHLEQVYLAPGHRFEADALVGLCGVAAPTALVSGLGATVTRSPGRDTLRVVDLPATAAVVGSLAGAADGEAAVSGAEAAGRYVAGLALRRRSPGRALPPSPPVELAGSPTPTRPRSGQLDPVVDLRVEHLEGFAVSGSAAVERLLAGSRQPGLSVSARSLLADLSRTSSECAPVDDLVLTGAGPLPGPSLGALAELDRLVRPPLRCSPLVEVHRAAGARLVEHDGWHDVWHYGDPAAEADAARHGVALRDATCEGWFRVAGTSAAAVVGAVTGRVPGGSDPGRIHEAGPCTVVEVSEGIWEVLAPVGGGGDLHERLLAAGATHRPWEAVLVARNEDRARLRLVGPAVSSLAESLGIGRRPGWVTGAVVAGVAVEVADRGDDVLDVLVPASAARAVWAAIAGAGEAFDLRPVGLAAVAPASRPSPVEVSP